MFLRCAAAVVVLTLVGCGAPQPKTGATDAAPAVPRAAAYRIDAAQSELRLLVYRAGAIASLGHNHVIVNRSIGGWAAFDGSAASAAFELDIPADGFVVDDSSPRLEEGADFAAAVTADAKAGTLHNMLSAALLDADRYPTIVLKSVRVTGADPTLAADIDVSIAGHQSRILVPFTIDASKGQLSASGEARLKQTDLGLTPYSVFLGALRVQDELRVKFKFVAVSGAG